MFSLIGWLLVILGCGMLAPAIVMWGGLLFMFVTAPVGAVKFVVHRLGNHAEPAPSTLAALSTPFVPQDVET